MGKKIVILNGSPRKEGNTSALAHAFTEGAESAGNTVTEFLVASMNIHGCKGCFAGGKNPESPCVYVKLKRDQKGVKTQFKNPPPNVRILCKKSIRGEYGVDQIE